MHPETRLVLHRVRAAGLRAEAGTHRLAAADRDHRTLRTRLGWTLVKIGLRLASAPGPAAVH